MLRLRVPLLRMMNEGSISFQPVSALSQTMTRLPLQLAGGGGAAAAGGAGCRPAPARVRWVHSLERRERTP